MQLNFKQSGQGEALIILHGLMGSLDNWQSVVKVLSEFYTVYTLDQRNHGKSPHSDDFSYDLLAADLLDFMDQQHIAKASIIGHSMGGKAAMHFALLHPERVNKLIVSDISPSVYEDRHNLVFKALKAVDLATATTREDVQHVIEQFIDEQSTVLFLMKGLYRDTNNQFQWRFNVPALDAHYIDISDFPEHSNNFSGKTLFVKGENSDYINASNYPDIIRYFPQHDIAEIANAGHWVHADNPQQFCSTVLDFLKK